MIGQTISHYPILEKFGGGMVSSTRPKIPVCTTSSALKFLPDEVARDPQALVRFQREAQSASALNHPNICTIQDIGEENAATFIAMEPRWCDTETPDRQRASGPRRAPCAGVWTPDGQYYIFQSTQEGLTNVWVVPDRSSWWRKVSQEPVQLTTGPLQFGSPLLRADGKKLLVAGVQPRAELVRHDAKSGDFVPYLGGISASDPDFSRDG